MNSNPELWSCTPVESALCSCSLSIDHSSGPLGLALELFRQGGSFLSVFALLAV